MVQQTLTGPGHRLTKMIETLFCPPRGHSLPTVKGKQCEKCQDARSRGRDLTGLERVSQRRFSGGRMTELMRKGRKVE